MILQIRSGFSKCVGIAIAPYSFDVVVCDNTKGRPTKMEWTKYYIRTTQSNKGTAKRGG